MKCTVCKNGICKEGLTSIMFDKEGNIVIFKNVSAMICDNCGAKYFDSEISTQLIKQAREARKKGSELEVVNLRKAA